MQIPESHPRYKSLMTRERLAEMVQRGLVTPTGLISHGRGEAFDYLMGERSTDAALQAEKAAAAYLLSADNPVICVNGNAAALDPEGIIALASKIPARIEVNLFHRTPERMEGLISYLESKGAEEVLGRDEVEFADEFTDPIPEGMSMLYLTMGFDPLTTKIEMATLLSVDCCEPKVRQFISELVPGFPSEGGPIEDEEIRGLTKNRASSEGGIAVEPFDEKTLRRYERCSEGMPVFRECMRMVAENMDVIRETFKQPDLPL